MSNSKTRISLRMAVRFSVCFNNTRTQHKQCEEVLVILTNYFFRCAQAIRYAVQTIRQKKLLFVRPKHQCPRHSFAADCHGSHRGPLRKYHQRQPIGYFFASFDARGPKARHHRHHQLDQLQEQRHSTKKSTDTKGGYDALVAVDLEEASTIRRNRHGGESRDILFL